MPTTKVNEWIVPEFTIADRLTKARERTGLDQREFGKAIGASRSTVINYENPDWKRKRSPLVLKAWAQRCRVPMQWLVTGEAPDVIGPDDPDVIYLDGAQGR